MNEMFSIRLQPSNIHQMNEIEFSSRKRPAQNSCRNQNQPQLNSYWCMLSDQWIHVLVGAQSLSQNNKLQKRVPSVNVKPKIWHRPSDWHYSNQNAVF